MRVFFAVSLSQEIQNTIDKFNNETIFPAFNNIKKVYKDNLHITLKFIGDIEESIVGQMHKKIMQQTLKNSSFSMEIQGVGVFPSPQKARIMWIGLRNNIDKITTIYNDINNILNELKIPFKDEKSFHPHITIGRFKESPLYSKTNEILIKYKDTRFGIININSITLFKSTLTSEKPIYTSLFDSKLKD